MDSRRRDNEQGWGERFREGLEQTGHTIKQAGREFTQEINDLGKKKGTHRSSRSKRNR